MQMISLSSPVSRRSLSGTSTFTRRPETSSVSSTCVCSFPPLLYRPSWTGCATDGANETQSGSGLSSSSLAPSGTASARVPANSSEVSWPQWYAWCLTGADRVSASHRGGWRDNHQNCCTRTHPGASTPQTALGAWHHVLLFLLCRRDHQFLPLQ
jgi:hypothetical protein